MKVLLQPQLLVTSILLLLLMQQVMTEVTAAAAAGGGTKDVADAESLVVVVPGSSRIKKDHTDTDAVVGAVHDVEEETATSTHHNFPSTYYGHHRRPNKINCGYACARRCRETSRKNVCARACNTCCLRCQCVPPGTFGHRVACPCYASMRTHGNKFKCP